MIRLRIEGPVGPAHSVNASDAKAVKRALTALRLSEAPADAIGIPNREMFDGIRRFQRSNRLRVDGEMAPAGPTAERRYRRSRISNSAFAACSGTST